MDNETFDYAREAADSMVHTALQLEKLDTDRFTVQVERERDHVIFLVKVHGQETTARVDFASLKSIGDVPPAVIGALIRAFRGLSRGSCITNDLICAQGHVEPNVVHRRYERPFDPCPTCAGARSIYYGDPSGRYHGIIGDGVGSAPKVDMGVMGIAEDRETFNRNKAILEQMHGGRLDVFSETAKEKKARQEERHHEKWRRRAERGITPSNIAEFTREKNAEAATKKEPTP